ncbi:DNA recombination protein RecN [Helicobacter didelphidarum]|uniref:DNA repair protein RecN n=1 Tax=Helicobacter didelphidarum TaxID=2040648 RepID=A0A3D8IQJ1_9HELI|nr:AAA family ATPase [Helicobacter didelphidarum]RDU67539.1 DNA recombination protein RecN [Helicobacter didelphidarum]
MIRRILINKSPAFSHLELYVQNGFNVISGVSGSGKSVFLNSILSAFGLKEPNADLIEISLEIDYNKLGINLEDWGISNALDEDNQAVVSILKKQNTRYFFNHQSIPKKKLSEISTHFIKYISIKDGNELQSNFLLKILDTFIGAKDVKFFLLLEEYKQIFLEYKNCGNELENLKRMQKNLENLKDFAQFEIDKITRIDPQIGEYERLLNEKKLLSKKEKVLQSCSLALQSIDSMDSVNRALQLLGLDNSNLQSCLLEVRGNLENAIDDFENLDMEPEELLNRIGELADIQRRYGSEEEALKHLAIQREKLKEYENIEFDKTQLEKKYIELERTIQELSKKITQKRIANIKNFEARLNNFAQQLKLQVLSIKRSSCLFDEFGVDNLEILLDEKSKNIVSSGEYNRMRLCVLCTMVEANEVKNINNTTQRSIIKKTKAIEKKKMNVRDQQNIFNNESLANLHFTNQYNALNTECGILILDEIDANLSGEESEGVAKLLHFLSRSYQIFAISHQPFMPLMSDYHYLVSRDDENKGYIQLLDNEGKIQEIARMISGSNLDSHAINYAKTLLEQKKQERSNL